VETGVADRTAVAVVTRALDVAVLALPSGVADGGRARAVVVLTVGSRDRELTVGRTTIAVETIAVIALFAFVDLAIATRIAVDTAAHVEALTVEVAGERLEVCRDGTADRHVAAGTGGATAGILLRRRIVGAADDHRVRGALAGPVQRELIAGLR